MFCAVFLALKSKQQMTIMCLYTLACPVNKHTHRQTRDRHTLLHEWLWANECCERGGREKEIGIEQTPQQLRYALYMAWI